MRFSVSEWLGEIIATTLAGASAGLVSALFSGLEAKQLIGAVAVSAIAGLVGGVSYYPAKWSWENKGKHGFDRPARLVKRAPADRRKTTLPTRPFQARADATSYRGHQERESR